ncbi:tRNA (N6-threonylcarbamoyladenosine(37)-N6)-methyltransferase TrmO [Methylobacterium gnaphalii]|uniref:tRNA (N6-threonylcarbamoyladenosine(37)-N6)-methyltransferase TrmO n=1 Tax=Methylobacterium gnaphalii TaxID=1010610 RepID=A0A512JJ20_9HYPH|nr:tRNA (N6-threonylcarbamoyladenosine(37)-N6)-methyltransferase TrmO [Methylobacterium gnaphalii]GEP09946.1 tRNA (N6-threonylcarbamoyladenosine(37)-N6)-methyltransferase TrmO [Methylobacterium gnaphalii]GJD68279.1 S-adenosyl-L-methionine-binding protein [Methylobacterium gnaphalii]GLS51801.1 tRNA (N6-threonylcarbamoyladenosine(37)-N6)-methyltransferase TrmO [Methylobacterium gnaphalii]
MSDEFGRREGEESIVLPREYDAGLHFIGRIRTPWAKRSECPKNGTQTDAVCTLEVDPLYAPALQNVDGASHLIVLYWMDRAVRDLVRQQPRHADGGRGTFSLRSPARPNPIAVAVVQRLGIEGGNVSVRGLDCLDGTPLLDIKPYYATTDSRPEATVFRSGRDGTTARA